MSRVRATIGVVGELSITLGVLLLLFVVWQLGYVGVVESNNQAGIVSGLEQQFDAPHPVGGGSPTTSAPLTAADLTDGSVFAVLRIPRLGGPTWAKPVLQGVGLDVLAKGLGHYPQTQLPGEVGNVSIAGHRAGHGNPLINIDAIKPGDVMVLETRDGWYVYRAVRSEIVPPTTVEVLAPVPGQPGVTPTQAWFTLTSCDPRYGSTNRYIVFSHLEQTIPRAQGLPEGLLADPAAQS
ncbi:MAG: class E sortase [Actinomycetota bacterium]|nr:class E sortase [Actinomycetota bacterium]